MINLDGLMGGFHARQQPDGRLLLIVGVGAERRVISVAGGPLLQFNIEPLSGGWRLMMQDGAASQELARFDDGSDARRALRRIADAMSGAAGPWSIIRWAIVMVVLTTLLILEFRPNSANINTGSTSQPELPMFSNPVQTQPPVVDAPPSSNGGFPSRGLSGPIPGGVGPITRPPTPAPAPAPQKPAEPATGGVDGFGQRN